MSDALDAIDARVRALDARLETLETKLLAPARLKILVEQCRSLAVALASGGDPNEVAQALMDAAIEAES